MLVSNLPKSGKNQLCWAGEKSKNEHDESYATEVYKRNWDEWNSLKPSFTNYIWTALSWSCISTWCSQKTSRKLTKKPSLLKSSKKAMALS